MAVSVPGYSQKTLTVPPPPLAVSGYTGRTTSNLRGLGTVFGVDVGAEAPTPSNAFPNLHGAAAPPKALVGGFAAAQDAQRSRAARPAYQLPGYGGHVRGRAFVAGCSTSAVSSGEAGPTDKAMIGPGAPGSTNAPRLVRISNFAPASQPDVPRAKKGYTGHLPGRHFSTNFGKSFAEAASEMIATSGHPIAGGVGDPGKPFIADTDARLPYPAGHVGRPHRSFSHVVGYAGYRPRTTPC